MNRTHSHKLAISYSRIGGRIVAGVALVAGGLIAGSALPPDNARGDVKDATPAQSFQNAAQLSLPVLKDIAATLHQMDARLSRLETIAQQMKAKQTSGAAAN